MTRDSSLNQTTSQRWAMGMVLALIALTGLALGTMQRWQKLTPPGVKVVPELIQGVEHLPNGTNRLFVAGTHRVELPAQVLNYDSHLIPVEKIVYDWLPKDTTYGHREYVAPDGFRLQNQVVLMGTDRTSIHQPEYCLLGSGWQIESAERDTIEIGGAQPFRLPVNRLNLVRAVKSATGETWVARGIFLYWFVADREITAEHRRRMWTQAMHFLKTREVQRWAYVICFSACLPGQEMATYERMKQFITASVPEYLVVNQAGTRALP